MPCRSGKCCKPVHRPRHSCLLQEGAMPLECRGEVELRNVSFAYPQRLGESSDTGSSAVWCGAALKVC